MMWGYGAWVWMPLIWVGVVALIVWAVRQTGASDPPRPSRLLDERFARGEIDLDEYEARRDAMELV